MNNFELGQKVLVRNYDCDVWRPAFYAFTEEYDDEDDKTYMVMDGRNSGFKQCIPLEGNEALIGRTGSSIDNLDCVKPEPQQFDFLQKVEVNIMHSDDDWEAAIYLKYQNETDSEPASHQVITVADHDILWLDDDEIRPVK